MIRESPGMRNLVMGTATATGCPQCHHGPKQRTRKEEKSVWHLVVLNMSVSLTKYPVTWRTRSLLSLFSSHQSSVLRWDLRAGSGAGGDYKCWCDYKHAQVPASSCPSILPQHNLCWNPESPHSFPGARTDFSLCSLIFPGIRDDSGTVIFAGDAYSALYLPTCCFSFFTRWVQIKAIYIKLLPQTWHWQLFQITRFDRSLKKCHLTPL